MSTDIPLTADHPWQDNANCLDRMPSQRFRPALFGGPCSHCPVKRECMSENRIHLLTPNAKRVRIAIALLAPYLIVQAALTVTDQRVEWSKIRAVVMAIGGGALLSIAIQPRRGLFLAVAQALGCGGLLGRGLAIVVSQVSGHLRPVKFWPALGGSIQWGIVAVFIFLACQALAGRAATGAPD